MPGINPFIKDYLMTAGPTPLPPSVLAAMAEPVVYHRAPAFDALFARVLERLPALFATRNDVLVLTGSGTAAMDSAVSNLVRPGQAILACAGGKFGERWIELGEAYEADVVRYEPGWGTRLDAGEVDRLLAGRPDVDLVYATLSETSTGVVHDVRALAEIARAGSQKALMSPPGLGFVSVSQRALDRAAAQPAGRYYLDWNRAVAEQRKGATPFTPAVTLLRALDAALDLIEAEGLPNVLARHDLLARAARAGVQGMGLELYGDPDERSTVVTALELPESIDGGKVPGLLRERGITANGGQSQLKGKILRIAHCGYFGAFDVLTILAGLELVLHELGADVELGSGVAAAQRVFAEAGVPVAASSA